MTELFICNHKKMSELFIYNHKKMGELREIVASFVAVKKSRLCHILNTSLSR